MPSSGQSASLTAHSSSLNAIMPSSSTALGHHHHAFLSVEASDQVYAIGTVRPRLQFELRVRTPRETVEAEIHYLRLQLKFAGESIGEGSAIGEHVGRYEVRVRVEVPVTRSALGFVSEHLAGDRLDLTLALQGWMRIRYDLREGEQAYSPPPGEWWFTTFGVASMAELSLQLPRSEWFKRVLEPIGAHEYLLTEIPLLKGGRGSGLAASYRHLIEAERHYAEGNDASVVFHCKAAIEALPGWPKDIFASLIDRAKAQRLDNLVKATKSYYDHGRHVAKEGVHEGDFPVNHREALFALNMAKVVLAETGSVLVMD